MAKVSELRDDFSSGALDTTQRWSGSYGDVSVVSGQARVVTSVNYPALSTDSTWDMTGSAVFAKMDLPAQPGNGSIESFFEFISSTPDNKVSFFQSGSTDLSMRLTQNGNSTTTSVPYDPVAMAYLRLREAQGTLYWDTSPDALSWTQRGSQAHSITSALSAGSVQFVSGYWGDETPDALLVDDVNVPPRVAVSSSQQISYDIRQKQTRTQSVVHGVRVRTSAAASVLYGVRSTISRAVSLDYSVRARVMCQQDTQWSVSEPLVSVSTQVSLGWDDRVGVGEEKSLGWRSLQTTSAENILGWDEHVVVTRAAAVNWLARQEVKNSLLVGFDVREQLFSPLGVVWLTRYGQITEGPYRSHLISSTTHSSHGGHTSAILGVTKTSASSRR